MTVSWLRPFWTRSSVASVLALAALPLLFWNSPYVLFLINTIAIFSMLAI